MFDACPINTSKAHNIAAVTFTKKITAAVHDTIYVIDNSNSKLGFSRYVLPYALISRNIRNGKKKKSYMILAIHKSFKHPY